MSSPKMESASRLASPLAEAADRAMEAFAASQEGGLALAEKRAHLRLAVRHATAALGHDPLQNPGEAVRGAAVAANASVQLSFLDEPLGRRLAWLRVAATWARRALREDLAASYPFASFHARLFLAQAQVRAAHLSTSPRARVRAVREVTRVFEDRPADWLEHGYAPLLAAEAATALEWASEDAEARGEDGAELGARALAALDCPIGDELFERKPDAAFELALRAARAWLRRAEGSRSAEDAAHAERRAEAIFARTQSRTDLGRYAFEAATTAARATLLRRRDEATEGWIERALESARGLEGPLDLGVRRDLGEAASYLAGEALFDERATLGERLARARRTSELLGLDARSAGQAIERRAAHALSQGARAALLRLDRAIERGRASTGRGLLAVALGRALAEHAARSPEDLKVVVALSQALALDEAKGTPWSSEVAVEVLALLTKVTAPRL